MSAEFVACMEDVLDLYAEPYDPKRPVVCFDETSKLDFAHFKPRRQASLSVGGTGQPGLSIYPVLRLGFVQSSGIG